MADQPPICVVDDDESLRRSIDGLLRSAGYTVVQFEDADSFLAAQSLSDLKCVISDIHMPGEHDGVALATRLLTEAPHIRVILISAFLDKKGEADVRASGIYAFLRKPFDGNALLDLVDIAVVG